MDFSNHLLETLARRLFGVRMTPQSAPLKEAALCGANCAVEANNPVPSNRIPVLASGENRRGCTGMQLHRQQRNMR